MRFPILQLDNWLPGVKEKLHLDGKKRFMLLLIFFNALLIAILLLSVRNMEIRRGIQIVEEEIRHRIEQLATIQANQVQVVYITATPTVPALAAATETPTETATMARPQPTPTFTSTPRPAPTWTPSPVPTGVTPTPTPLPGTPTFVPTWTPTVPTPVPPTSTPTVPTPVPPTPTFTPAPPREPSSISLTASPANLTADGLSTSVIRASVLDQYGHPVPDGTTVVFSTDQGTFWGATTVSVLTTGGIAEAVLTSPTSPGSATIHATAGSASGSIGVTFSPGPPAAVVLSAQPDRLLVGGSSIVRAVVTDSLGHPVADGTTVRFATTLGTLASSQVNTSGGVAEVTILLDVSGSAVVTATAGSSSGAVTIYVLPQVQIAKTVSPTSAPAGSMLTYTIVVRNASAAGDGARLQTLSDRLPAGFVYVPGSMVSAAFPGEPSVVGQDLVWTSTPSPYNLASGDTIVSTFQVIAQAATGTYPNVAIVGGQNFDPVDTGATAQVTLQGPILASIVPNAACNDAPVNVSISGAYFAPGITAQLGSWPLSVIWVDEAHLDAVVPRDIAAGLYDLVVTNPGGATATLPQAYNALNCGSPDTTLDSGYLGTYGAEPLFSSHQGDDDQLQVLFLEVPDTTSGPLYVRVFDPDCGGSLDVQNGWAWDTPFTYTVYGGSGAYTHPDARSAHPTGGAHTGTLLAAATFAEDAGADGTWYALGPLDPSAGEQVGSKRVFKLAVVGGPEPPFSGGEKADLNVYNVALSTSASSNTAPSGSRILAFSWTYLIPAATYDVPPRAFPYVAAGVTSLTQHNWDFDNDTSSPGSAGITMVTPLRTIAVPDANVSPDGEARSSDHAVLDGERSTTWAISAWAQPTGALGDNLVTFWATDQNGTALAIFARSTTAPPP